LSEHLKEVVFFNFYTQDTYTQTSRGGTLLLVKNYLNPTLIETNVQAELCWININPHPNVNIVIGSCYRPEVNENIMSIVFVLQSTILTLAIVYC
jgi:hypothetical protein